MKVNNHNNRRQNKRKTKSAKQKLGVKRGLPYKQLNVREINMAPLLI